MTSEPIVEDDRTSMSPAALRRAVLDHLRFTQAKDVASATATDAYLSIAHATRDRLVHRWISTMRRYAELDVKRLYYLSAEYLLGRQLESNLLVLGVRELAKQGFEGFGLDMDRVLEAEHDPGLGNGGLGRLAACFMDSLATMQLPAMGYGLRYEFGIFRQELVDGWQVEHPDEWLQNGNPWEIRRPEYTVSVPFGGHVEQGIDPDGVFRARWIEEYRIEGVPYDMPVAGYGTNNVHTLRLWSAQASEQFDLAVFNDGDYRRAVERKALDEALSKVLYPKDTSPEGRELRLKQQYFFTCCSIADLIRRYRRTHHDDFSRFADKVAIQLNDTHPAIAVAELMRVLVDTHGLEWDAAWEIVSTVCGYTNHTLLPEALERWSLSMFEAVLPRHLQIIREIDRRFLRTVHVWSKGDANLIHRMAIVDEPNGQLRMAHLAVVGSRVVNGVAELHGRLLREEVLADFASLWPERFTHVTNGVTPRRWLLQCNPGLAAELTRRLGPEWVTDLERLDGLMDHVDDPELHRTLAAIKRDNKVRLASSLVKWAGIQVNPDSLFDVQIKRIHEYKRQLMCCLHVMWLYHQLRFQEQPPAPRTVIIGGKAAPGYVRAKEHIKLINDVASTISADPAARELLRMVYVPNYDVSRAERIIPAADLSEQISLAGKEASGTGNMKFMMNGALTIGTLDGANVEIFEEVGPEAFFLFGLDADTVHRNFREGYSPSAVIASSQRLQTVLGLLDSGFFQPEQRALHQQIAHYLRNEDPFMVCADFDAYVEAQEVAAAAYADPTRWGRMVVRNIARSGRFSSDRTIREYADRVWGLEPVSIDLLPPTSDT